MKKILMIVVLLLSIPLLCQAQYAIVHDMNPLVIVVLESGGDDTLINEKEQAYGLMQIRQDALTDFNKAHDTTYELKDLLQPWLNLIVGEWYLLERIPKMISAKGEEINVSNILIAYNWGISHVGTNEPIPDSTLKYINDYFWLTFDNLNNNMDKVIKELEQRRAIEESV